MYRPILALVAAAIGTILVFFFDCLFEVPSKPLRVSWNWRALIPTGLTTPFWLYFFFVQIVLLIGLFRAFWQQQCRCPLCTPPFSPTYRVMKHLGEGTFAKVLLVLSKKQELFAIKQARIEDITEANEDAFVEMQLLLQVEHKGLVKVEDSFFHAERGWGLKKQLFYCLVEEYCGGGDLFDLVQRHHKELGGISEEICLEYFVQILEGLDFMHGKNIIHRDLKLENILVTKNGELKIADLGLGEKLRSKVVKGSYAGTEGYAAPEIWSGRKYSKSCDIWSLGILLFTMQGWTDVFTVLSEAQLSRGSDTDCIEIIIRDPAVAIQCILDKARHFPIVHFILEKMLKVRPQERISTGQLLQLDQLKCFRRSRRNRDSKSSPLKS